MTTVLILVFTNVILPAFILLAVRRSARGLKKELKRNKSLRERSEQYRQLFEETSTGVCRVDTEGRFTFINRAGAKILGLERAGDLCDGKLLALPFFSSSDDESRYRKILERGESIQKQYIEIRNARGETLHIAANARAIRDGAGNLTGYDGFFRDMTQSVTAQEALWSYSDNLEKLVREKTAEALALKRKEMELEKRAAVGEMAMAVVHELRNPLSSMKMAFLAIKNRFVFDDESIQRSIEDISAVGERMERILKDVLDFARPQELRLIRQDIRPILEEEADSIIAEFGKPGIVLRREYASENPPVSVDSARLGQAVRNLLQNSVDAVRNGRGEITLKAEFLREDEVLRITVSDNGPGIAAEDIDRVFEPFFTRKDGGAGLGLTLVRKIAEAHHGRAAIDSRPGRGTAVKIELPAELP